MLQKLAISITVTCVRNTIIEDYHARGSLSQDDMKAFNKQVASKIYTLLWVFENKPELKREMLTTLMFMCRSSWDSPVLDDDLISAFNYLSEHPDLLKSEKLSVE